MSDKSDKVAHLLAEFAAAMNEDDKAIRNKKFESIKSEAAALSPQELEEFYGLSKTAAALREMLSPGNGRKIG